MPVAEPIATALNDSTYTAIEVPKSYNLDGKFFPVSVYTSDGSEWYLSNVSSPSADKPVVAGQTYNDDAMTIDESRVAFYAKASSGTPNLIVLVGRP